jgi:hypothetical protein
LKDPEQELGFSQVKYGYVVEVTVTVVVVTGVGAVVVMAVMPQQEHALL